MKFAARRHICTIKMDLQTQSEILLAKCNRRCDGIVPPGRSSPPHHSHEAEDGEDQDDRRRMIRMTGGWW